MTRIVAVLVVLVSLSACSDAGSSPSATDEPTITTAAGSMEPIEVPELGFTIDQPEGWVARLDEADSILEVTAPARVDGFLPNFNVSVGDIPTDLPAAAYFEGEVSRLQSTLPDVEILEVANLTIDGAQAKGITLTSTENDNTIGISRLIILDTDNRAYEVTFFAAAQTLERLGPLVQDIFSSFRFIDG